MANSTFLVLKTVVTDGLGQSDTKALTIAGRGVNLGQLLAAIMFDPTELQIVANLTSAIDATSVSLSSLTNLLGLISIYNTTGSIPVFPIAYDRWNMILPSLTGYVKYYTKFGSTIYIKPTPTVNNTLSVSYRKYPTVLVNDGDTIDFTHYDEFITTVGLRYAWAALEETEASDLIGKVGESMGVSLAMGTKLRSTLEEVIRGGYKLQ